MGVEVCIHTEDSNLGKEQKDREKRATNYYHFQYLCFFFFSFIYFYYILHGFFLFCLVLFKRDYIKDYIYRKEKSFNVFI